MENTETHNNYGLNGKMDGAKVSSITQNDVTANTFPPKRQRTRVMTDRRREQNRRAQKNRRAKQKHLQNELTNHMEAQSKLDQPASGGYDNTLCTHGQQPSDKFERIDLSDGAEPSENTQLISGTNCTVESSQEYANCEGPTGFTPPNTLYSENWPLNSPWPQKIELSPLERMDSPKPIPPTSCGMTECPGTLPFFRLSEVQQAPIQVPPKSTSTISESRSEDLLVLQTPQPSPVQTWSLISPNQHIQPSNGLSQLMSLNHVTFEEIFLAGFDAIHRKYNQASQSADHSKLYHTDTMESPKNGNSFLTTSYLPSPSQTHLHLRRFALKSACLANALHIGVDIEQLIKCIDGQYRSTSSPFYQAALAEVNLSVHAINTSYQATKPDLRPCAAQIKQPHPLYIDIFPFPTFRQRILALRLCTTANDDTGDEMKIFDEDELCRDINNDGIVYWGATESGLGVPWDRRSWECQPWFLRKWWMVTGGIDGELGVQSRWWAEMRGDVFETS